MMEQTVSDVENFTKNVTFGGGGSDLEVEYSLFTI